MSADAPVIALVGRPNVGKSTLFNALTQTRNALVYDRPGVTRDRHYGQAKNEDREFLLIDTGGWLDPEEPMDQCLLDQTVLAIQESDLLIWVVDGTAGVTGADLELAKILRQYNKPLLVVVNKSERLDDEIACNEFYTLGLSDMLPISARHGYGLSLLWERLHVLLPGAPVAAPKVDEGIRVAVVGRPNVGKSTLVNRLLGEERMVVFDAPGTTRDSIEVPFESRGQKYCLIDTAGVRRRSRIDEALEHFSVAKTLQSIRQSQVVIFVLNGQEGIVGQDLDLLDFIVESGRSLVIAINQWDMLEDHQKDWIKRDMEARLSFVSFAPVFFISALHGTRVGLLLPAVKEAFASASKEMSTSELTRILHQCLELHQPPLVNGRRIKLRYAHAGGHFPPTIVIHGKQTQDLPESYQRFLQHRFLEALGIIGNPLRLVLKTDNNPYIEE